MNNNRLTGMVVILLALVFGIAGWVAYRQSQMGTLDLTIVPQDAQIILDGKGTIKPGTTSLGAGQHSLSFSRDGFGSQTTSVDIQKGQKNIQQIVLQITGTAGLQYYADHPDQAREAEGISGQKISDQASSIQQKDPIIAQLPFFRREWRVDYGKSQKHPEDPNAIALYITVASDADKQDALDWIRSVGYDPNKYEIIYQSPGQ
ncbi:MAG TPA: hypothetical protein VLF41_01340 [Candidatus Nanoarchaeia archaeon]|nr:hypothetical protein [Candidatus Nanoarchaeia archaeon]